MDKEKRAHYKKKRSKKLLVVGLLVLASVVGVLVWSYLQPGITIENRGPEVVYKDEVAIKYLPFKTVNQSDPSMPKGKNIVLQGGLSGIRKFTYQVKYVDHKEVERKLKSDKVTRKPIDEIVAVGVR